MGKLKELFEKVQTKFNNLSDKQITHVKTVGWILGTIIAIWLFLFLLVNFTDVTIVAFAVTVISWIAYVGYTIVFRIIEMKSKRRK